jgi:hypothetical protein
MGDPSLFSRVSVETAPFTPTPPRTGDSRNWLSVHSEVNLARISKANLLVVGAERLVSTLVSLLADDFNSDVVIQCRDGLHWLPPASSLSGAVVLRDVDALKQEEQVRLLNWLNFSDNRSQVVSTTSTPLLPLVEACAFDPALYYRLNTIYIDLSVERASRLVY